MKDIAYNVSTLGKEDNLFLNNVNDTLFNTHFFYWLKFIQDPPNYMGSTKFSETIANFNQSKRVR